MGRFIKKTFFRGLAALLPTVLTVAVFVWLFRFLYGTIGRWIVKAIAWVLEKAGTETIATAFREAWWSGLIAFFIAFFLVIFVGFLLFTFVGTRLYRVFERILLHIPFVKQVYPYAKQVVDFIFKEKQLSFAGVVAIEYPRKGIYALGFLTAEGVKDLNEASHRDLVNIFIPSSPTPFTGYTIFVPREDIIPMSFSIEEALRLIVSGGVLVPEAQKVVRRDARKIKTIRAAYLKRRPKTVVHEHK